MVSAWGEVSRDCAGAPTGQTLNRNARKRRKRAMEKIRQAKTFLHGIKTLTLDYSLNYDLF
jgi:hypothetical protein